MASRSDADRAYQISLAQYSGGGQTSLGPISFGEHCSLDAASMRRKGAALQTESRSSSHTHEVLTGTQSRIFFLTLGAGVTPAQGSVKPTAGFITIKFFVAIE